MRVLRVILIPIVPGLMVFFYLWAIDGDANLATCVPNFFVELAAGALGGGNSAIRLCRRLFFPLYLLLFLCPLIAYSLSPKRQWLQVLFSLAVVHLALTVGIMLQDD
jgi:hypothetical protein